VFQAHHHQTVTAKIPKGNLQQIHLVVVEAAAATVEMDQEVEVEGTRTLAGSLAMRTTTTKANQVKLEGRIDDNRGQKSQRRRLKTIPALTGTTSDSPAGSDKRPANVRLVK
jgi:hypothetical protein